MTTQRVYVIYNNDNIPCKVSVLEPNSDELNTGENVCVVNVPNNEYDHKYNKTNCTVDITYNPENAWYPKGSLFIIYDGDNKLIGSEQGYSHKKAKSIVKNLLIAYPDNEYKIVRK